MDHRNMSTDEELAVYKAICRLPLRQDEIKTLMKRSEYKKHPRSSAHALLDRGFVHRAARRRA